MSDIYQLASIGMLDGRQRLDAISLNAANASLPGYRRHVIASRVFDATLSGAHAPAQFPVTQQVNVTPGALMSTGRSLDVAIESDDSYFALTDGTTTWLTRSGAFNVDESGALVGENGLHLVGMQGNVTVPGSDVTVESDGRITHQSVTVATLQLYQPTDRASLIPARGSLLSSPAGVLPADANSVRVRGGALEASNTDSGREMLSLMTVSRQFESLSRVLQSYDSALGSAIQKLGG